MWTAQPQALLEEAQAANQWPRGHPSKDQTWLDSTTKEPGVSGSRVRSGLARGGQDQSEALGQSALRWETMVGMSP